MVPRPEAKMIRLIGYSARPATAVLPTRPAAMSVIPISPFGGLLVIEELQLHCEFVRLVAGARIDPRVGSFDVEVVAARQPRQSGGLTVVVAAVVRAGLEVLLLEAHPRLHLQAGDVVAGLRRERLLFGNRGERLAAVEGEKRQLGVDCVLAH